MRFNGTQSKGRLVAASIFILALVTSGCGVAEGDGGTAPMRRALLAADGEPIVVVCQNGCVFEGRGINKGTGCAGNIRGVTSLQGERDQLSAPVAWELSPDWVVGPGETFLYDGCCFDQKDVDEVPRAVTEIEWDDVECS